MLISQAQAAEVAGEVAHGAFYESTTFLVAAAFILFFVIFGKKMGAAIGGMLDERSQKISDQLDEARRLREEAQELLASFEKKQHEALEEAKSIVTAAKDEAERLAAEAAAQLEHNLQRSEQLATDRINQAQAQAVAEVKDMAVEIAVDAAKRMLTSDVSAAKADALIDDAIKDLDGKLH